MRRLLVVLGATLTAALLWAPKDLRAQEKFKPIAAWDGPSFMAPGPENALGAYFVKPKDTDGGVALSWRSGTGLVLGVRGEYVHDPVFGSLWGIGGEAKGGIGPMAPPLAVNWTAGIGALITGKNDAGAGEADLRVPVGLSLGLRLVSGELVLTPYVHPRVSLAYVSFNNGGGSDTTIEFDTDVGADLQLTPGFVLRIGGTFGDQPALGAGLAVNLGRF